MAQLGHLYGSRSGTLRLGSLRCRAYLAEPYSVARRAVRDNPSSSTEYRHLPCGIAHLPVRTATFCQKQSEFQCWFDPSRGRIPSMHLPENLRTSISNQEKNYSLAFSYVELTLKGCCGKTNFDAAPYDVGVLIDLMNTLLRVQR